MTPTRGKALGQVVLSLCHPRLVVPRERFCALSEPLHTARPLTMSATTMSFAKPAAATTARAPVPRHATFGHASLRRSKSAALPRRRDRRAVLVRASGERVAVIGEALWVRATSRGATPTRDSSPTARLFIAALARTDLRPSRVPSILHIVIRNGILLRLTPRHAFPIPLTRASFSPPPQDSLPAGLFLGGAPANVACHLNELGRPASVISRVGDDELGREVLRRLRSRGVSTDTIQIDDGSIPTGFVVVTMKDAMPTYDIVQPSAWDAMEPSDDLVAAAKDAVVVYGSLAQRDPRSRAAITVAADAAAKRVFDVNLRAPFIDPDLCVAHAKDCWLVKLNDEELPEMYGWLGLSGETDVGGMARATFDALGCEMLCVTRGGDGAALITKSEGFAEHPGFVVDAVDTVGAGDSFLATLLDRLLDGASANVALERACRVGAFVATQQGATPRHDQAGIDALVEKK